ncbi:MAG: peptidoglycan-associated lipoprotein Pal [Syntrophotaleaceae bacterium]
MKANSKKLIFPTFLILVLVCLLSAGCAKKPAATDVDTTTATTDGMATEQMDQQPMGVGDSALGESGLGEADMGSMAGTAVTGLERIHFDFDQYNLTSAAQETLVNNASYLKANPGTKVRVEGYCDERGSDEYNLALGQRRAEAAKNYLVSLGVAPERLAVISYGEEMPLDPSATEEAYAKNRRAEFKAEM